MTEIFRRRYFISLSYMLIVVFGLFAWLNIPLEMAPEMHLPSITVSYNWANASPEVMEQEITRPVEQAAVRLRNVEQIRSVSEEGRSMVTVTFEKQTPVEYRVLELQEYLYGLRESLPPQVRQPVINRSIPEELEEQETFMAWSISGDRTNRELYQFARENIRLQLLGLEGLDEIEIHGGEDPALVIRFNSILAERYGLDTEAILDQVQARLGWHSAGFTEQHGNRNSLLVPPRYNSLDSVRDMRVSIPGSNRQLRLGELADVQIEDLPAKQIKRLNGKPALSMSFLRESGSDAIRLAQTIREEITRIEQGLPEDISLQLERDTTEELRAQFRDLQAQSVFSLLLVFVILLLFIRRLRAPFVILGSILFSLLMSISILFFLGYTMNVLTLAGLTVALGMVIDNAVVVFEQLNPGLPTGREQRLGHVRKELPYTLVPVFGSTLTTIGIFLPLFFAMEELQLFLVPLAVALSLTLLSSVFVALTWIPYALVWLVTGTGSSRSTRFEGQRTGSTRKARPNGIGLNRFLLRLFDWRHRFRWIFYIGLVALIGLPLFAIGEPDWEETKWPGFSRVYFDNRADIDPWIGGLTYRFFNETYFGTPWGRQQQQRILINIRTPQGTPIEEIDKMATTFEQIAAPYTDAFDYYETEISEYSGARLQFYLKEEYLYEPEPYRFYGEAMFLAARTGNSGISVSGLGDGFYTGLGGGVSGHRIDLRGFAYEELLLLARDIQNRLKQNPRVQEVDIHGTGWGGQRLFQYVLNLDQEYMAMRNLDRQKVLNAIQLDVSPTYTRGRVELAGERHYLVGQSQSESRYESELLEQVRRSGNILFRLDEIATLSREQTLPRIIREDQAYQRMLFVDFLGPYRLAQNTIETVLDQVPVPVGASIRFGNQGFSWGQEEQTRNYLLLMFLTVLSVWMIVSALLESWLDPMVVILAVPLSLIGVMAGALWHDINFDQGAIAGTLLAIGVVVNNSILLVHEKQRMRALGIHGIRSWVNVYRSKMRPVLITSFTTIGGLLPMIWIGASEFWNDLAVVVAWGLGTSLFLLMLFMGIWEKTTVVNREIERTEIS
ncbi:MAG: efflux RND transporter permease subunit [Balneolaceae bacterium]